MKYICVVSLPDDMLMFLSIPYFPVQPTHNFYNLMEMSK